MPETRPLIGLADQPLDALAAALSAKQLPPVDRWDPETCGDSRMRITADGRWFYHGEVIARPAMVRLFASVLRRELDGTYLLVTPVEKLRIDVDDLPFRAVAMRSEGAGRSRRVAFDIEHADAVIVGPSNPVRIVDTAAGPAPSVLVRNGLEARVTRTVYYELADIALAEDSEGFWSGGAFFPLTAGCA